MNGWLCSACPGTQDKQQIGVTCYDFHVNVKGSRIPDKCILCTALSSFFYGADADTLSCLDWPAA